MMARNRQIRRYGRYCYDAKASVVLLFVVPDRCMMEIGVDDCKKDV